MRTPISTTDNGKSKSQEGEVNTMSSESKNGNNMRGGNLVDKIIENNLLAATIIATVSFAAGIAIPGGFKSEGRHAGTAVLTENGAFTAFVVLNTASFLFSSLAVFFHLFERFFSSNATKHFLGMAVGQYLTTVAMMDMMGAFLSATWALLRSPDKYFAIIISWMVGGVFCSLVALWSCQYLCCLMLSTLFKMMPEFT